MESTANRKIVIKVTIVRWVSLFMDLIPGLLNITVRIYLAKDLSAIIPQE